MEIAYRIEKLEEILYTINFDVLSKGIEISEIGFRIGHEIKAQKETNEIFVTVHIYAVTQQDGIEVASEGVRATFFVDPFEGIVTSISKDGIEVSDPLLIDTFINVAIGAARGMMTKNFKGTLLNDCVFPLIPMQMIRANATGKKQKG